MNFGPEFNYNPSNDNNNSALPYGDSHPRALSTNIPNSPTYNYENDLGIESNNIIKGETYYLGREPTPGSRKVKVIEKDDKHYVIALLDNAIGGSKKSRSKKTYRRRRTQRK